MLQVKSLIPDRQERELHGTCNFPNSVAAFLHVCDGKEHDSWRTGAEPLGDFPDSEAADTTDYVAGEEPDPWAAGARAPGDGPGREQAGRLSQRPQE